MQPNNPGQPFFQGPTLPPAGPQATMAASVVKPKKSLGLIFALIISLLLLFTAVGFGVWAFGEREDYKNNSDKKAAAAVKIAEEAQAKKDATEFAEREKSPTKNYTSPSTAGTISVTYPKTWGAFVTESEKASSPVDGYFHPGFVPGIQSGTSFALRVQVLNQAYDQVMKQYEAGVKSGKTKVAPYRADKVDSVLGSRVDGEISPNQQGSMIVLPLRDKTIKIFTESQTFIDDFNSIVLANLTFSP